MTKNVSEDEVVKSSDILGLYPTKIKGLLDEAGHFGWAGIHPIENMSTVSTMR
jgi:hypothetical protein